MVQRLIAVTVMLPLLLINVSAQAFVGGIAVSIGRATNTEGAKIAPFSADAQIETEENQMTSKVYYKPGMVRDEMNTGGMQMVTIQRFDEGKVWILMGQGMYMESKAGQSDQAPEYKLIERSVVGKEDINGMPTTKYKTVYEGKDGRFGGFTWFTDDNIAVKGFMISETKGEKQRIKWTMSNVQRGNQPDSLFQLPAGAKPMGIASMMSGMGGAMPGRNGSGAASPTAMPSQPAQQPADKSTNQSGDDPNMAEDMAAEAAKTAADTAKQETNRSIQDSVRKGIGKLFGR
jgi:hypothetical protein